MKRGLDWISTKSFQGVLQCKRNSHIVLNYQSRAFSPLIGVSAGVKPRINAGVDHSDEAANEPNWL